jgi:hypothetical protein
MFTPKTKRKRSLILVVLMSTLNFGTYMACLWESRIVVSHKHAQIYTKIRWYWSCSWAHWILVHIWRAYENLVLWCLISTLKYIPKPAHTGRAHEHTEFWFIYVACLWESRIVVSHKHAQIYTKFRWYCMVVLMSTLDFGTYMACLWESRNVMYHKHAQIYTKIRWYWSWSASGLAVKTTCCVMYHCGSSPTEVILWLEMCWILII